MEMHNSSAEENREEMENDSVIIITNETDIQIIEENYIINSQLQHQI